MIWIIAAAIVLLLLILIAIKVGSETKARMEREVELDLRAREVRRSIARSEEERRVREIVLEILKERGETP